MAKFFMLVISVTMCLSSRKRCVVAIKLLVFYLVYLGVHRIYWSYA
jgi:hypothetical protein